MPLVTLVATAQVSRSTSSGNAAGDITPGWQWISEGFGTTAEQARQLEEQLARKPDQLAARAKLIAYYVYNANPNAAAPHAMWVIEHHPESELAASTPVNSGYINPAAPEDLRRRQAEFTQLWLRQAALHYGDARVLGHAGTALMVTNPSEAERLLLRARDLDRANDKWLRPLARLYAEAVINDSYQTVGLTRCSAWQRLDSAFAARARGELDRALDAGLVGTAGSVLANLIAFRFETRAGQDAQIAQARQLISDYASSLLKRALASEPKRIEFADALRLLNNRRLAANGPSARFHRPADGTNTSGESSGSPYPIPPTQQRELLVSSTPPVYPPLARQARIQGIVRFRVRIGTDGRVKTITLVHGHPLLVASAEHSARTHVYRPTVLNGRLWRSKHLWM